MEDGGGDGEGKRQQGTAGGMGQTATRQGRREVEKNAGECGRDGASNNAGGTGQARIMRDRASKNNAERGWDSLQT